MHFEVLVEEPSAEAALEQLLPRITPECTFRIHAHRGKLDLLAKLGRTLGGFGQILRGSPELDWRVVVLVDADDDDCRRLKQKIVTAARGAGLAGGVLARIAVEELEAWFLGDVPALRELYPAVPAHLGDRRGFRDPDAILGGTWEALERVLQRAGYHMSGLPKIEAARAIAARMNVEDNRSRSFQVFRDGLRRVAAPVA